MQGTFTRRGNGCYCHKSLSTNVLREHLQLWYGVALIVKCLLIVCSLGIAGVQCSVYRGPVCVLVKTVGSDFFKILKVFQFWDVRWWLSGFKGECFFACLGHFGVKVKSCSSSYCSDKFLSAPYQMFSQNIGRERFLAVTTIAPMSEDALRLYETGL